MRIFVPSSARSRGETRHSLFKAPINVGRRYPLAKFPRHEHDLSERPAVVRRYRVQIEEGAAPVHAAFEEPLFATGESGEGVPATGTGRRTSVLRLLMN